VTTPDVEVGSVHGVFFRHIPHDGDPLHRAVDPTDARWQHGDVTPAWYLADEPETAWAEWYRALAEVGVPPAEWLPRDLWSWRVDLEDVALLDSNDRLTRAGLEPPRPSAQQWPAYQAVGDALFRAGHAGLLALSAARPEHRTLVVFRSTATVDGCTPVPPPTIVVDPPRVPRGMRT
jgi:RES domain-containing protein